MEEKLFYTPEKVDPQYLQEYHYSALDFLLNSEFFAKTFMEFNDGNFSYQKISVKK
jgi:hypothetical protein